MSKQKKRWITLGIILVFVVAGLIFVANWRSIGKQMANPLRGLLGVETVAQIETTIFKVQDQVEQWKFDLGLAEAEILLGRLPTWWKVNQPKPSKWLLPLKRLPSQQRP